MSEPTQSPTEPGNASERPNQPSETGTLHEAIAVGIDRGLRDLGADVHGCTPSMLTGHVIKQLREAGLHPPASERPNAGQDDALWNRQVAMRDVLYRAIKGGYDEDGFDWHDIPAGHFNRIVKIVADAMVERADSVQAKYEDALRDAHRLADELDDTRGRADAAEAKLAEADAFADARTRERNTVRTELDEARAKLDDIGHLLAGRDDDDVPPRIVASIRKHTPDPGGDRPGHEGDPERRALLAEERLSQAMGWCKEARAESAAARAKLVELSDAVGDDDPCFDHVNHSDAHNLLNQVRALLASYFAAPAAETGEAGR